MLKKTAVIFDFDGTITNGESLPKDWTLNKGIDALTFGIVDDILVVTHRHENFRKEVSDFIQRNLPTFHGLYMRRKQEEPAVVTKRLYANMLLEDYDIVAVFDDDEECCEMYKEEIGCTVFHVM